MPDLDVRRQLEVFAREIGEIHRRERERSRELERTRDRLDETYLSMMQTLAFLVEAKDAGTRTHLDRTRHHGMALARLVSPALADRRELEWGFLLHDIGKVGIPEAILTKEGPLTPAEWAVMRTHPVIGVHVVSPMGFLGRATDVIRCHHERWDGAGYPRGLRGEEIPLAARIFSVVDAFDAMTSDRPYRRAMSVSAAAEEVAACSGTQFDPEVVEAFLILMEDEEPARSAASLAEAG